uniref:Uncharacterized protein n=1 Tax=viral metagenome TaxID=1070528 RepID=A0A6C0HDY0_9ZZZZ
MSSTTPVSRSSLPTSLQPAIKRAKLAIQALLLDPTSTVKLANAQREIQNADCVSAQNGRRRQWRHEALIVPHYNLISGSWYCEAREPSWEIDKMPQWAYNGSLEPNIGTMINGFEYTYAPKSSER